MISPLPDRAKFTVTQADIDEGVESNCYKCPVALAACRFFGVTPADNIVNVLFQSLNIGEAIYNLNHDTMNFIHSFDLNRHEHVRPFEVVAYLAP